MSATHCPTCDREFENQTISIGDTRWSIAIHPSFNRLMYRGRSTTLGEFWTGEAPSPTLFDLMTQKKSESSQSSSPQPRATQ